MKQIYYFFDSHIRVVTFTNCLSYISIRSSPNNLSDLILIFKIFKRKDLVDIISNGLSLHLFFFISRTFLHMQQLFNNNPKYTAKQHHQLDSKCFKVLIPISVDLRFELIGSYSFSSYYSPSRPNNFNETLNDLKDFIFCKTDYSLFVNHLQLG